MTAQHLTDTSFESFHLPEPLMRAIQEAGYTRCTPIQAKALPLALSGQNIIGQAQTGTGKTATFLISVIAYMLKHNAAATAKRNDIRALILAPTRELATQIHQDALTLLKHTQFRAVAIYGGADYDKQRTLLEEGADIVIATPGRIIDYIKQNVVSVKHTQALVIDEADRMFDLGFINDVRYLLRKLPAPEQRLNLMFSATLSYRVIELAYEHLDNPDIIKIEAETITTDRIAQTVYFPANNEKLPLLVGLIQKLKPERAIVFVNMKIDAERVSNALLGNGIQTAVLSGDVPQKKRLRLVLEFQLGKFPVLVATDVAARGLHIANVSHVINYDLPQEAQDYVHRIGRTGRIGAEGVAISFACESYAYNLPDIEKYIGKKIQTEAVTKELLAELKPSVSSKNTERVQHHRRKPGQSSRPRHGQRKRS
jgi:ATP-dependent RNA helicase RhlB